MSSGDEKSARLLMRGLATFAAASGLVANNGNSNVYFCNTSEDVKVNIIRQSGFKEGDLPFIYLGVNVNAKKLSNDDCQILIDKIVARIRIWGGRTMSYTARVTLANFVLLSLHTYWAILFILPRKVLEGVMAVCRNYIWDGKAVYSRAPPISWDIICRSKREGGLGVQDCITWNIAAMGKYVWDIENKNDSLWLRWVNHHYIKGRNWKRLGCPAHASWQWKQIWKVKEKIKHGFTRDRWNQNPARPQQEQISEDGFSECVFCLSLLYLASKKSCSLGGSDL
uniref:Uncharacterized protein n=1 Tax=Chenopodium quinoa TaxID=63459 RepID=A0A803NBH7_CHEQI